MRGAAIILLLMALRPALHASVCDGDTTGRPDTTVSLPGQKGVLEIRSTPPGARVYADTQYLGSTPLSASLNDGSHILRYVPPDADRWLSVTVIETLTVHPGDQLLRTIEFPILYHITTEPYGATVRRNGVPVGKTPLDLRLSSMKDLITVTRDGYNEATVPLTGDEHRVHVLLRSLGGEMADRQSVYLSREQSRSPVPIYITTGATILTGAAAAFFKIRADNYYSDYKRTGNEGSLAQVHGLDVASGVSLAASELSLMALAYVLLSR